MKSKGNRIPKDGERPPKMINLPSGSTIEVCPYMSGGAPAEDSTEDD